MTIAYKHLITILFINFLFFKNCNSQTNTLEINKQMDSFKNVGIQISKKSFDSLIANSIVLLETKKDINRDEYIVMIRLYNTVEVFHLSGTQNARFKNLFFPNYIDKASKSINATLSKGMCYYSKEYDIYIGGKPHNNSQYIISREH